MSLKRGIFYTLLTQAPTLLLFFIASTLMTRLLGDEGRGAYALLNSQIALWSMLLWLNIGFGITYFTSKAGTASASVVGTASTMLLVNLVILPGILATIFFSPPLRDLFMPLDATHWGYYAFVFASMMLGLVANAISAVLLGTKQFKALNLMSILNAALSAVGFLLLFLFKGNMGSTEMLPAILIVSLAAQFLLTTTWIVLYVLLVKIPPIPTWAWSVLRPMIAFSLVGHLSNLVNLINYRFDVWVVDQYHGTAALGLYAVAVGVGQLLFYIPEPFSRVVQPFLYGQVKDEMLSRYKAVSRVNFSLVLVLAVLMALLARWVIPLLFGEVFRGSVTALQLLLPGIVFSSAYKLLAQLVVQGNAQSFNLYATSAGAVVTIALDFLLIPEWGIEGAAIASSLSYLTILLVVVAVIRFRLGIAVHDLFIVRRSDLSQFSRSIPWRPAR